MRENLLIESKEIYDRAIAEFKPMATVLMLSGGDDSLTTLHVAKELGIKIDFIIHGNTRTGIKETTIFSRKVAEGYNYLEADAGNSYINYVMRKGFFGVGLGAHCFSYHILKQDHFEKTVSKHIRQGRKNFPIIFINGGRQSESENRKVRFANPLKVTTRRKNDMWVNLINHWHKPDCRDYLDGNGIERNQVAIKLCRSGECFCGTTQSKGDREEASFFYPDWGKQLDEIDVYVKKIHGFGWGENRPKQPDKRQLDLFQPMCVGCSVAIAEYDTNVNAIIIK